MVSYSGVPALFGISLEVKEGEVVAVVGSNGAGKSTLLRGLSGVLKPESGSILMDGKEIAGKPTHEAVRHGIVMVPEGRHLFGKMTIYQNLMMGAYLVRDKAEIAARLEKVYMAFPRLKEREKQYAGTLSGGEQQMVALARGMMSSPKILLLDEPSLGLAPIMVKEMFRMVRDIRKQGVTILLVEQRLQETLAISDRAYVLQTGKVVMEGDAKALSTSSQVRQAYLGM
ncbi:High-affinity branched-chain amino acid transport ATP-binding protein LivF [bioreactor metagenome]|uniref:High-affinity branched-chain amino acid transport ATP-binding protein LivF n=1 Tax=bioreactor metagenome TaxID=1076179 RepID=A0A645F6I1_9ZZZZ